MKKTLLSMVVGLTVTTTAWADNLTQVYEQALSNDPVVNRAKADRDAAFKGISLSRANLLPQLSGSIGYTTSSQDRLQDTGAVITQEGDTLTMELELGMSLYDHSN